MIESRNVELKINPYGGPNQDMYRDFFERIETAKIENLPQGAHWKATHIALPFEWREAFDSHVDELKVQGHEATTEGATIYGCVLSFHEPESYDDDCGVAYIRYTRELKEFNHEPDARQA